MVTNASELEGRGASLRSHAVEAARSNGPVGPVVAASLAGPLPHTAVQSGTVFLLMWVWMLAAMLFRWPDYAQQHYGHADCS